MRTYSVMMKDLLVAWVLLFIGCHSSPTGSSFDQGGITRLKGTRWRLDRLQGQYVLAGTTLTHRFEGEAISGFSGCNYYGAEYSIPSPGQIEIGEIALTDMKCQGGVGVMDQDIWLSGCRSGLGRELSGWTVSPTPRRCPWQAGVSAPSAICG